MTAKEELLVLVETLTEESAERVLAVAKEEAKPERVGDAARLREMFQRWREEDEAMDPAERERIHHALDTLERVRFREAHEW